MHTVFVFAHQDDEIAVASRIREAVAAGHRITCVCLTDGAASVAASIRDAESRAVLEQLGCGPLLVAAPNERIGDGTLPDHMDRALGLLESLVPDADEVVTLAWEGGHQDHDATNLVAAVFAERRGLRCIEMPLYNGEGTRYALFRVSHAFGAGWTRRRIPLRQWLETIFLTRIYRSQRRTWLGLGPMYLLAGPWELTRAADPARALDPPHARPLLYERRFGYSWERFESRAREFLRLRSAPG